MVDRLAVGAGSPAGEACNDAVDVHVEAQDGVERDLLLGQQRLEGLGLGHGAREPVEQEPAAAPQAVRALAHDLEHGVVRDELTARHVRQRVTHRRRVAGAAGRVAPMRKTSPVDSWHAPRRAASSSDCVPFPTPGAPSSTRRSGRASGGGDVSQGNSGPFNQALRVGGGRMG